MSESARNIDRWYTAVGLQANSSMAIPVAGEVSQLIISKRKVIKTNGEHLAVEVFMCIYGLHEYVVHSKERPDALHGRRLGVDGDILHQRRNEWNILLQDFLGHFSVP
jgi:hypothetical protein